MSEAKSSVESVAGRSAGAGPEVIDSLGMNYLVSLPRRVVTVYLPLFVFVVVLLFPFYWMTITALKPDAELLSREGNPFWVMNPTLIHIKKLLFASLIDPPRPAARRAVAARSMKLGLRRAETAPSPSQSRRPRPGCRRKSPAETTRSPSGASS